MRKSRREISRRIFALGISWGRGGASRYAAAALIVALSLGYSDVVSL
jgi:hypothetical protein